MVDDLLDVLPASVEAGTQQRASNLANAYKRSETVPSSTASLYALESGITDRAEPSESLAATLVWSAGLPGVEVHLDERVLDTFPDDTHHEPVPLLTGRCCAYLPRGEITVTARSSTDWIVVADTGLGHAALRDRLTAIRDGRIVDEGDPTKFIASERV